MFERPQSGECALIVHIDFRSKVQQGDLAEFSILAESAGARVIEKISGKQLRPDPKYFLSSGKVEEITELVKLQKIDLVLIDHPLSPAQERNLEKQFQCRVLDRTGLILDIFAQRAQTHEGKLQVELAQLQHLLTRLVRGWTHLERQKGGIGLRGPGETQLETDRRLVRARIKLLKERLVKVRKQRAQGRAARKRSAMPVVSCVGYTNAGKSSLFNLLTDANVYQADQLFATLDPTLRRILIPSIGEVVLADTVGFIRHLPHDLVEAFQATLDESREADLLLHVVDISDDNVRENILVVEDVLEQIGADKVPRLLVCNKVDLMDGAKVRIDYTQLGKPWRVWVSAATGEGVDLLLKAIAECLSEVMVHCCMLLTPKQSELRAQLHQLKAVLNEAYDEQGNCRLEVMLNADSPLLRA